SISFLERIPIFRSMLFSNEPAERELSVGALKDLLSSHVSRMGSPSLVRRGAPGVGGGGVPPRDWRPTSHAEWTASVTAGFDTIRSMLTAGPPLEDEAWRYLTQHLRTLLLQKQFEAL